MLRRTSVLGFVWIAGTVACGGAGFTHGIDPGTTPDGAADTGTVITPGMPDATVATPDARTPDAAMDAHTTVGIDATSPGRDGAFVPVDGEVTTTQHCSSNGDCADTDPCTVNERCDTSAATPVCRYGRLDRDGDGYPPAVCGGGDCDDSRATIHPNAPESCNGFDDNCDGTTDGDAPVGVLASDPSNCGACGHACGSSTAACVGGTCIAIGTGSDASASGDGTINACGDPCSTDTQCQSVCATPPTGYRYCCSAASDGICYQHMGSLCPSSTMTGDAGDAGEGGTVDPDGTGGGGG